MIHPSYVELMKVVNNDVEIGEEPVVNSRYSIVIATAKRARQLISGAEPTADKIVCQKPLSIAVEELYERKVKILTENAKEETEEEKTETELKPETEANTETEVKTEAEENQTVL